ncbi:MAG: thermonuclease family protein [Cyanobacteria bacterium J083]|nr:MAG: thermonuclease family protein [Cyanobacteria bacterium J083]
MKINRQKLITILSQYPLYLCLLLLLLGCQSPQLKQTKQIQVTRVISGQSLEAKLVDNQQISHSNLKIRLIGINSPDLRQNPWGESAKEQLEKLIAQTNGLVSLETEQSATDNFGRILAYVWQNKTLLNESLVKQGYVLADWEFPHRYGERLLAAQRYARIMGYGIWQPQNPLRIEPKQFRRKNSA